jgi:hypothetical protein
MGTMRKLALALGAVALLSGPALAQQRGGFGMGMGGPLMLIGNEGVQKEIGLDAQQIEKVNAFVEEQREKQRDVFQKLQDLPQDERREKGRELMTSFNAEVQKGLKPILKPEQAKRFEQIRLQTMGIAAFTEPEVRDKLKLNDSQQSTIRELLQSQGEEQREIFQNAQGNFEEARKQLTTMRKQKMDKAMAALTDDQKSTWKDMIGSPYEVQFQPPRRPNN